MDFEWDEVKREANLAKHFIDFVDAATIWRGHVIDPLATREVAGESRRLALGTIGDAEWIIAVVYTPRDTARRIISARRARRSERQVYQDQFGRGR